MKLGPIRLMAFQIANAALLSACNSLAGRLHWEIPVLAQGNTFVISKQPSHLFWPFAFVLHREVLMNQLNVGIKQFEFDAGSKNVKIILGSHSV